MAFDRNCDAFKVNLFNSLKSKSLVGWALIQNCWGALEIATKQMKILELNIWEFYKNKAPHHKQRMLNSCFVSLLYFLSIISALHWSIRHAGYKQKYIQKTAESYCSHFYSLLLWGWRWVLVTTTWFLRPRCPALNSSSFNGVQSSQ